MNLKQFAATALTVGSLATATVGMAGCDEHNPSYNSAGEKVVIGDEFRITKNPNPQKGYKLKVKIKDAPQGGFGYVGGSIGFDIDNIKDCGYFLGGSYQGIVPGVGRRIPFGLTKISDTEYEGTFYKDWGKDGDFYGKGVCHWIMKSVGVGFSATGKDGETMFTIAFQNDELHDGAVEERFYRKEEYPKSIDLPNYSYFGFNSETSKQHEANNLFSIILTAEEIQ